MYDTFSDEYDRFVNWKNRLAVELPFLEQQLKQVGAKRVLDSACGTGMHAIALAQAGFQAAGADLSARMIEKARTNARAENVEVAFQQAGFGELQAAFGKGSFEAILCLGNSLPHLLMSDQLASALEDFAACLKPAGLIIIQNRNFDAVMADRARWMEPQYTRQGQQEWIFLRFYDFEADGLITFHILRLHRERAGAWEQKIHSTKLRPLLQEDIKNLLENTGFESISYYGDMTGTPFKADSSGNLVVCARRTDNKQTGTGIGR